MTELKYTYALDETMTRLVHINDARKGEVYYCVNSRCNEQMIVKDGDYKRKHFSHIGNGDKCSYDNYLHTLAELKFIEWFESGRDFIIELKVNTLCSNYQNCIWRSENRKYSCKNNGKRIFKLSSIYNKIEHEKNNEGFIWDLLLTNTNKKNWAPTAIEIYVTHKCTNEKVNSGIRFIEVKITSEEQLDNIIDSGILVEEQDFVSYNFTVEPDNGDNIKQELNKVMLNDKMKAKWKKVDCRFYTKRQYDSIFELTLDDFIVADQTRFINAYYWACAIFYKKFKNFRHCSLCSSYKYNDSYCQYICVLYKKLRLEDKHDPYNALKCSKYNVDDLKIKQALEKLKYLSYNVWENTEDHQGRNFKRQLEKLE